MVNIWYKHGINMVNIWLIYGIYMVNDALVGGDWLPWIWHFPIKILGFDDHPVIDFHSIIFFRLGWRFKPPSSKGKLSVACWMEPFWPILMLWLGFLSPWFFQTPQTSLVALDVHPPNVWLCFDPSPYFLVYLLYNFCMKHDEAWHLGWLIFDT